MWQVGVFAGVDMGQGDVGPSHIGDDVFDNEYVSG